MAPTSTPTNWATYDHDWLTRGVGLSLDRCLRVEIEPSSLVFSPKAEATVFTGGGVFTTD
ncbi:MAG: hypothetical protein JSS81_27805 [Acidobacteria bacterium]|nr:hypothetical protein [Acidobacteriota bacterium]